MSEKALGELRTQSLRNLRTSRLLSEFAVPEPVDDSNFISDQGYWTTTYANFQPVVEQSISDIIQHVIVTLTGATSEEAILGAVTMLGNTVAHVRAWVNDVKIQNNTRSTHQDFPYAREFLALLRNLDVITVLLAAVYDLAHVYDGSGVPEGCFTSGPETFNGVVFATLTLLRQLSLLVTSVGFYMDWSSMDFAPLIRLAVSPTSSYSVCALAVAFMTTLFSEKNVGVVAYSEGHLDPLICRLGDALTSAGNEEDFPLVFVETMVELLSAVLTHQTVHATIRNQADGGREPDARPDITQPLGSVPLQTHLVLLDTVTHVAAVLYQACLDDLISASVLTSLLMAMALSVGRNINVAYHLIINSEWTHLAQGALASGLVVRGVCRVLGTTMVFLSEEIMRHLVSYIPQLLELALILAREQTLTRTAMMQLKEIIWMLSNCATVPSVTSGIFYELRYQWVELITLAIHINGVLAVESLWLAANIVTTSPLTHVISYASDFNIPHLLFTAYHNVDYAPPSLIIDTLDKLVSGPHDFAELNGGEAGLVQAASQITGMQREQVEPHVSLLMSLPSTQVQGVRVRDLLSMLNLQLTQEQVLDFDDFNRNLDTEDDFEY